MESYREVLAHGSRRYGTRVALRDATSSYTYPELEHAAEALARGLRGLGMAQGARCAWLSPNTAKYLPTFFATARAGLMISPLNFWLAESELRSQMETLAADCVLTTADRISSFEPTLDDLNVTHRIVLDSEEPIAEWVPWRELFSREGDLPDIDPDLPHEIIFTSGTTGQSKGVVHSQRQRVTESKVVIDLIPHPEQAHVLRGSPQFHIGGIIGPLQTLLQGGMTTIYKFNPRQHAEFVGGGVDYVSGVPAQYAIVAESGALDGVDVSHVKACSVGGNGASVSSFQRILDQYPNAELVHFYGSTESGLVTAIHGDDFLAHLRSVGRVAPGVDLRIVGDDGREVSDGAVGEVVVRSPYVMREYFGRPELTAQALDDDGYLRMGDLGRLEDGYLYIVGRKKDMIISGGENVYPKEVEDVIEGHPDMLEAAVIGVPDDVFEERAIAYVIADPRFNDSHETREQLRGHVRSVLAGYKVPAEFRFVDDLPRNALGKVDKVALRREYQP
ncbi:class I adenylate-forming enzyme family protein [Microbacterium fluvii]|uniref:Class I adenylate-forming enzyme family protein n=1 Tax=Microbacterium fluvii TaxID=415215 RepID=A0ABW2H846_9MICO|nr:class I adenylate-forming enzyme family protein [Microbacterium fluvii]MCU4671163.1 acyl--CoA ligase [Microbacterium fluvii]